MQRERQKGNESMEGKRSTTRVRIRAWTPASGYSLPPSPLSSQLSWDDSRDEDFQRLMDENGIIGLTEMQEEQLDQKDNVVLEEEEDMFSYVGTPEPEDGPNTALEDFSCHLSELLDSEPLSQLIGDDSLSPAHNGVEYSVSLEDWSHDDDDDADDEKLDEEDQIFNIHRHVPHLRPDCNLVSGILNSETEQIKLHRDESESLELNVSPQDDRMDSYAVAIHPVPVPDIATLNSRTPSQNSCDERSNASSSPLIKSVPQAPTLPQLSELNVQDETSNHEMKPEAFAELAKRSSCRLSYSPRAYQPVIEPQEVEPVSVLTIFKSENDTPEFKQKSASPRQSHHQLPITTPRDTHSTPQLDYSVSNSSDKNATSGCRGHYRPSKTCLSNMKDVRKGQLSHPLPDFSKIEPRVRFPKSKYTPPKRRTPPHKDSSKPKALVVLKSPADIVREALLSNSEGLPDSVPPTHFQSTSNTTMPEEFRCPLQASAIVQQLQEDYNKLLTKYAEAENTIDRLRLETKVCLDSDPPKPSQPALLGVLKERSKVMTLSFPQAQRAELGTEAVYPTQQTTLSSDSFTSSWRDCPAATPLTEDLSKQMARFQLQVNDFEKLLKSRRLEPSVHTQGLSQLTQGQESIEKDYLAARERHRQLHRQTGGKLEPFDPDRELESLIFQSGIQLEELKEWIEQSGHNRLIEATPCDPPQTLRRCASLTETEPQPASPACAADVPVMISLEVSSVSGESDGGRDECEEDMHPSFLRLLNHKHQRVEKDFSNLMDHYQKFRNVSKQLDKGQDELDHNSVELRNPSPHPASIDRKEIEQPWRSKDKPHTNKSLQPLSVAVSLSGPSCSSHVCNSMETLPEAPVSALALPRKQGSGKSAAGSMKSHSSQEERAVTGRRFSKETKKALRAQLQDGVVTPETDSGFLGSESSHVIPAAQSPVQQRAAVRATRPSVTQEKYRTNPESITPAHTQPSSDPFINHTIASRGAPGTLERKREARMRHIPSSSASSSPLRWPSTSPQPWPSSDISELEQQSGRAHSLSDDGTRQGDQCTQPSNQDPAHLRSSSITVPYRHDDHRQSQSSGQLANHHQAIESLQVEVHRLKKILEGTLRTASSLHRVRAPPSPLKDIRDRTPPQTFAPHPRPSDFRESVYRESLESKTASKREPRETGASAKSEHERSIPRRRSASVPRLKPKPDTSTDSEYTQSEDTTPKHFPSSPVMAHTTWRAKAETGRSPKTHSNRQRRSVSADRSDVRNVEAESRGRPIPLCLCCVARRNRTSEYQTRNITSPSHTPYYTNHCPLCGSMKTETAPSPANQSSMQKETRPVRATHMQTGGMYLAVAPGPPVIGTVPVLQCLPVCSSVLYYSSPVLSASYQKPLYVSPSKDHWGHRRRSQSLDAQRSLNRSLDRIIAAASSVREMSERMVRSLSHQDRIA